MSKETQDFSHIEDPLNQAAKIIAEQRNLPWDRTIRVSPETKGIHLNGTVVNIEKSVALEGNPLETVERILKLAVDFDRKEEEARAETIKEAKEEASWWIGFLQRHLPAEDFQRFIEDEVGLA